MSTLEGDGEECLAGLVVKRDDKFVAVDWMKLEILLIGWCRWWWWFWRRRLVAATILDFFYRLFGI